MTGRIHFVILTAVAAALPLQSAYAYVDPGSGTIILQVLAMVAVGAMFYMRVGIDKIKSFFRYFTGSPRPDDRDKPSDDKENS